MIGWGLKLAERGLLPLPVLRRAIRRLLLERLASAQRDLDRGFDLEAFERRNWRALLEARRAAVMVALRAHYGRDAARWYQRWRLVFLACEELFGFAGGGEWGVGHYRLARSPHQPPPF